MLTSAQINFLRSQAINVRVVNGQIKGGDAQYDSYFADPNALDDFRTYVKNEVSSRVEESFKDVYKRISDPKYRQKHFEALMFKLSVYLGTPDDYQFIKQEAAERGISMQQMADAIISAANSYNAVAANVERRRVQFNLAVDSAATLENINALWYAAEQAIGGM